jgi:hypothetical protein
MKIGNTTERRKNRRSGATEERRNDGTHHDGERVPPYRGDAPPWSTTNPATKENPWPTPPGKRGAAGFPRLPTGDMSLAPLPLPCASG